MPQMHLRKPLDLHILLVDHLQKKKEKKEYKHLNKQKIHDRFIKAN